MPLCRLNHCMSRRTFVKRGFHLLVSIGAFTTVQAIRLDVPPVLAQTSEPAQAYGTGAYGQGAYGGDSCTGGCAQQDRRSQPVVSVYLPLITK